MKRKHKVALIHTECFKVGEYYDEVYRLTIPLIKEWVEISDEDYKHLLSIAGSEEYIVIEEPTEVTNGELTNEELIRKLVNKQKDILKKREQEALAAEKKRQQQKEKNKINQIEKLQKRLEKLKNMS